MFSCLLCVFVFFHLDYEKLLPFLNDMSMKDEAYLYFSHTNVLYPFLFPATRKFETEIISMMANMLRAKESAGNLTSGGTESIFMAVKCWREYGKRVKKIDLAKNGRLPNIIVCDTAHPAFHKASHYLNIEVRKVGIDKKNGKMDIRAMQKAIDNNTILVVASAPNFPTSVVDDIPAIANIVS